MRSKVAPTVALTAGLGIACFQTVSAQNQPAAADSGTPQSATPSSPQSLPSAASTAPAPAESLPFDLGAPRTGAATNPSQPAPAADQPPDQGSAPADAQTAPLPSAPSGTPATPAAPSESANQGIEEVVVTARRVRESQQSVPVAISALSAEALQREQINTAQDLQGRVPSLSFGGSGETRNAESPTIRGQGANYGASPGVVIYFGEVPMPADYPLNAQGGPGKFFDAADLQILKGSQGTLFGRNTTGGAMLIEPHKPEDSYSSSLSGQASNYNGQTYEGLINAPLIDDKLLMRAGFQYVYRKGFTDDLGTNGTVDGKHYWTSRVGLTWRPTEGVENYLLGYYTDSNDNGTGVVFQGFNGSGLNYEVLAQAVQLLGGALPTTQSGIANFQTFSNRLNLGCLLVNINLPHSECGQALVADQQARGIRSIDTSLAPRDAIKTGAAIDQFSYEIDDILTLRNIASFTHFEHAYNWDADGSIAELQDIETPPGYNTSNVSQTTEELQLQGKDRGDKLKYVVGGYYQRVLPAGPQGQAISALFIKFPIEEFSASQQAYAPYAQATYNLGGLFDALEGLSLTGGLRYTTDQTVGNSSAGGADHTAEIKSEAFTYTAGVDYKLNTNLLYAKISRGYKAGGFAPAAVLPSDYTFKPEYVTNYELGTKSDFKIGEVPARVNTSLYYTDYADMQRSGIDEKGLDIGAAIFNAGKAAIYGFEFESTLQPLPGLRISSSYSYSYGHYNEFNLPNNNVLPQLDCTGNLVPQGYTEKLDCIPFQATPRHQASMTTAYHLPLDPALGAVEGSLTYSWTAKQYSSAYSLPEAEPGAWLGSFGLLNANLAWRDIAKSNFDLSVFGTNLTDRDYRISNSNVWNLAFYQASVYGEPRIFGALLSYHWDN